MNDLELLPLLMVPMLLWLSAFFSGSETALYTMSQVRLNYLVGQGDRRAKVLNRLYRPLGPTIITILIGNNIMAEMLARITERSLSGLGAWSVLVSTLVLTPLVLVFAEFLPKWLARRHADRLVYQVSYMLTICRWILIVPVVLAQLATRFFQWLVPGPNQEVWEPHTNRSNLRTFLRTQGEAENLTAVQQKLVDRTLALERITLAYGGVSKPLDEVQSLASDRRLDAVRASLGPKYYQRYLVSDPRTGIPIGWVSAQALVLAEDDQTLEEIASPLLKLPQDTPVHLALQQMHADGTEMALVTDRIGRTIRVAFRGDCVRVLLQLD